MESRPASMPKRCVFIINPTSGAGKSKKTWAKQYTKLQQELTLKGFKMVGQLTSGPNHATILTQQSIQQGADVVVAVGGDGTIHEVAQGFMLARASGASQLLPSLAVWPVGTGSDFARTLGWDNSVEALIQRIVSGAVTPLDMGRVTYNSSTTVGMDSSESVNTTQANDPQPNDERTSTAAAANAANAAAPHTMSEYFVNVASCGVGAWAARKVPPYKIFGAHLAYQLAAFHALVTWHNQACEVCLDGGDWQLLDSTTLLAVGNGKYWGGGIKVARDAQLDDGLFDVVMLQGYGLISFLSKVHLLKAGKHLKEPGVTCYKCRSLQVRAAQPAGNAKLIWELDGECKGCCPVSIDVIPGAINLCTS
eukprot:jgi/Chrzof1/14912/Cz09g20130.t1